MKRLFNVGATLTLLLTSLAWGTDLASAAAHHHSSHTGKVVSLRNSAAHKGVLGTVTALHGAQFIVKGLSGKVLTVNTTATTKFYRTRGHGTLADIRFGEIVAVTGPGTGKTVAATRVAVLPPFTGGTVTAVGASSITLTGYDGKQHTVHVTAGTDIYKGIAAGSLADVAPGNHIVAVGTRNADGSIKASHVAILVPLAAGVVIGTNGTTINLLAPLFHLPGFTLPSKVVTTSSTTFFNASTFSRGSLASATPGMALAAIGTLGAGGTTLNATTVILVPASVLQKFAASLGLGALFGG